MADESVWVSQYYPEPETSNRLNDQVWQQYCQILERYRFYWNITLRIAGFFYLLSGVIASFYITHREISNLQWILFFPIFFGGLQASFCNECSKWVRKDYQTWFKMLASSPDLCMCLVSEAQPLRMFLAANTVGAIMVSLFLLIGVGWGSGIFTHNLLR